jgi:hypothetical protein
VQKAEEREQKMYRTGIRKMIRINRECEGEREGQCVE